MIRIVSIIILVVTFGLSCTKSPTKYELSRAERQVVDSTFRVRRNLIKEEIDSICTMERKKNAQHLKDSLIKVRLEEIENVMNQ